MNLLLTPDIETSLVKKAQHLGTTPELLALDLLRQQLLQDADNGDNPAARNLAEFLGPHVGVFSSSSLVPGGARLSEACGRKFAEGLLKQQRKAQQ